MVSLYAAVVLMCLGAVAVTARPAQAATVPRSVLMYFRYTPRSDIATVRAMKPNGTGDTALFTVPVPAGREQAIVFASANGRVVTVSEPKVNGPASATVTEYSAHGRLLSRVSVGSASVHPPDLLPGAVDLALSPDGRDLAFVTTEQYDEYQGVRVLDVATGRLVAHPVPANGSYITALAWGPGPSQLAAGGEFGSMYSTLKVLSLAGRVLRSYPARVFDTAGVVALGATPSGLFYAGDNDNQENNPANSVLFQPLNGGRATRVQSVQGGYEYYLFTSASLSPDHRRIALTITPDDLGPFSADGPFFTGHWGHVGPTSGRLSSLPALIGDEPLAWVTQLG